MKYINYLITNIILFNNLYNRFFKFHYFLLFSTSPYVSGLIVIKIKNFYKFSCFD